jgi:hypothetical protein
MTTVKKYTSFILIAALSATAGWGASALAFHQNSHSISAPQGVAPVAALPASSFDQAGQTANLNLAPIPVSAAIEKDSYSLPAAQPVVVKKAAPVARASRPRVVSRQMENDAERSDPSLLPAMARNESHEASRSSTPAYERKKGMSNKTKTAIVIGGGAATGAIIGGIAGGGKGAAIGAIAGGGAGALYSIIRNKQHKPVW